VWVGNKLAGVNEVIKQMRLTCTMARNLLNGHRFEEWYDLQKSNVVEGSARKRRLFFLRWEKCALRKFLRNSLPALEALEAQTKYVFVDREWDAKADAARQANATATPATKEADVTTTAAAVPSESPAEPGLSPTGIFIPHMVSMISNILFFSIISERNETSI
jgi:hypothetical protein